MLIVISKIKSEFNVKIPLILFIANPLIRDLSNIVKENIIQFENKDYIFLNRKSNENLFLYPPISVYGVVYRNLFNRLNDYNIFSFDFIEDNNLIAKYAETSVRKVFNELCKLINKGLVKAYIDFSRG